MRYDLLKSNKENAFYPVTVDEINEVQNQLSIKFPKELTDFYLEVGYGFIKGSKYNVNRIMDPYSVRDFRLRQNDFEYYQDIELYDDFEENKLIFFECNESALMSIDMRESEENPIYYYDIPIAKSLKEFLMKIQQNDRYYRDLVKL